MWKDWLAFSRREQYGIVFLAFIVVLFLGIRLMLPHLTSVHEVEFRASSSVVLSREKSAADSKKVGQEKSPEKKKELPAFNPNLVSVTRLDEMGVAPYVIVNWMKYREAGGEFEVRRDIRKIYGLDSALAVRLENSAYFHSSGRDEIAKNAEKVNRLEKNMSGNKRKVGSESPSSRNNNSKVRSKESGVPEEVIIEINQAKVEDFQELNGIGEVYSNRIVAFREALGGFYTIEQLSEVYGISSELFENIQNKVKISSEPYRKISINQASVKKLKKHPYLDFYQARDIVEYRRENGNIKKSEVLRSFSSFSGEQLEKVLPYLSFVSQNEGNLTKN